MNLFLFDIDGTLLHTNGLSKDLFFEAIDKTFGVEVQFTGIPWKGLTDYGIALHTLQAAGVPQKESVDGIPQAFQLLDQLWQERGKPEHVSVYDGVVELLELLDQRIEHSMGLFTANCQAGATQKIRLSGLAQTESRFEFLAHGDRVETKTEVLRDFLKGLNFAHSSDGELNIWVLGDTPADIESAQQNKLKSAGVATGRYSYKSLDACKPDLLFKNFSDPQSVLDALLRYQVRSKRGDLN